MRRSLPGTWLCRIAWRRGCGWTARPEGPGTSGVVMWTIRYRTHMSAPGAVTPADGRGGRRARGEPRERAILSAVIALLGETGYEAMTMDAVAARAHASKTTIYRRWRGKPELVKAAVDGYVAGRVPSWADTGSLRGDLMTVMRAMRGHLTDECLAMMSGLIHAMRTDPELAAVLRSHLASDHSAALPIIARAADRGEVPAGAEEA